MAVGYVQACLVLKSVQILLLKIKYRAFSIDYKIELNFPPRTIQTSCSRDKKIMEYSRDKLKWNRNYSMIMCITLVKLMKNGEESIK